VASALSLTLWVESGHQSAIPAVKRRNAASGCHSTVIDFRTGAIRSLFVSGIPWTSAPFPGRGERPQHVVP
jgi:hypothetical protein